MRVRTGRYSKVLISSVLLLLALGGCAQNALQVKTKPAVAPQPAVIQSIKVAGDADRQRVEIVSSQPVTYTSYKSSDPLKVVLDISQAELGTVSNPIEVNSPQIKQILVADHSLSGGKLCRVEVLLAKDADYAVAADPANGSKLVINLLPVPKSGAAEAAAPLPTTAEHVAPSADDAATVKEAVPAAVEQTAAAAAEPATEKPVVKEEQGAASVAPVTSASEPPKEPEHQAAGVAGKQLTSITDTKTGIDVAVAGGMTEYKSFRLNKPDRLVIDMPGVKSGISEKAVSLNGPFVKTARIGIYADKIRVVFDAAHDELPEYKITPTDAGLQVSFSASTDQNEQKVNESSPVTAEAPVHAAATVAAADNLLDSIDFKIAGGASRIIMNVGKDCIVGTPVKSADGIMLTIKHCRLPKNLQRPLDTRAFASPVSAVTPYQVRIKGVNDVRVAVALKRGMPFSLKREGRVVFLDVTNPPPSESAELVKSPLATKAPEREYVDRALPETAQPREVAKEQPVTVTTESGKKVYTGRRVTLEFADADVRKIFQLIAEVSNLNFLIGDDVTGTMSLKLVNVPWDQALDVILESRGLGMQREGNIVQIKPKNKIQSQEEEDLQAKKARESAMPLVTEVYDVNFASVSDVESQFNKVKTERGTVIQDTRTNRVIVKDIAPAQKEMRALLKTLDIPEKQVLIEARIVEATEDSTRNLGIQWGAQWDNGNSRIGFGGAVTGIATGDALGLPGLTFGTLINHSLDLRLEALATINQVKIVSTPKILTLNNKAAKITQGSQIPYVTTSAEGTKVQFVAAELTLEVTPHITADGNVILKVSAKNDSVGADVNVGTAAGATAPAINTKQATSEMLVKNGETTVIGGIYLDRDTNADTGVPFLKDIPLIGGLFKSNTKAKNRSELLIFITPKIVM